MRPGVELAAWELPSALRRPERTASVDTSGQPLYQVLARWRNYDTALADLFARLPTDGRPTAERPQ